MTRQWLSPPEAMCLQHLLGEHAETHMFLRKMEKNYSLQGFYDGSMFFGAPFLLLRHELLSAFISGHKTPLIIPERLAEKYPLKVPDHEDFEVSVGTLVGRCLACEKKHEEWRLSLR